MVKNGMIKIKRDCFKNGLNFKTLTLTDEAIFVFVSFGSRCSSPVIVAGEKIKKKNKTSLAVLLASLAFKRNKRLKTVSCDRCVAHCVRPSQLTKNVKDVFVHRQTSYAIKNSRKKATNA